MYVLAMFMLYLCLSFSIFGRQFTTAKLTGEAIRHYGDTSQQDCQEKIMPLANWENWDYMYICSVLNVVYDQRFLVSW